MKTLFFSILLITSLSLSAQITEGYWMVGGNAAFSYSKFKSGTGSETFKMDISPDIGYFFFDKIAVGAEVHYFISRSKFDYGTSKSDRLFLSPFVRYYFLEVNKPINVFLESSYRFSTLSVRHSTAFSVKGGLALFLNSSVAFEITLEYLNSNAHNIYVGSHTILLGFGIQVHLKRK